MIELKNIHKKFNDKTVIDNLSFNIKDKGITGIMAPSGTGKTTIINLMLGIYPLDKGRIINLPKDISVVFQEDRLLPYLTPYKNLTICKNMDKSKIDYLFKTFNIDNSQIVANLSGGMKRRIAICRALAFKSSFIILDEPFKGLDDAIKKVVMNVITEESKTNPILLITHNIDEITYLKLNFSEKIENFSIYK